MTGFERNSDIIFATAYAPLLQNLNSYQWTPNLIAFDATQVIRSISYYVQQLFAKYTGDQYVLSTLPTPGNLVQWSASSSTKSNELFVKIANAGPSSATIEFDISSKLRAYSYPSGTVIRLTGSSATTANTAEYPDLVVPIISSFDPAEGKFNFTLDPWTVAILILGA